VFSTADTIVAIATPPGRGGVGIVRLSGTAAPAIARALLGRGRPFLPRHATFGRLQDTAVARTAPRVVDEVIVTWFQAPRSYTREDVVEIAAHGSPAVLNRIVELAINAGARLAEPGEFTLRAHLNGRIDLVQAEAVVDLVDAVTPLQARAALDQLEGTLTARIAEIESKLFDLVARLEASLDFPDEGFQFISRDEAGAVLEDVSDHLRLLAEEGRTGRLIREGGIVAIVGRANAGKSSLFNALVGASRAIVTDVPGTTRDALTERVDIGGVPVTLVDTAGLRATDDAIEREGMRRTRAVEEVAALRVVVIDGSAPIDAEDLGLLSSDRPTLVAVSKSDLERAWGTSELACPHPMVRVSVVNGDGLADVRRGVVASLTSRDDWRDPPAVTNIRHTELLRGALQAVNRATEQLRDGGPEELVLADLSDALDHLGEVTGRRTTEDLLAHIFSRFCVGK
jgi:tRNA modification GTPase